MSDECSDLLERIATGHVKAVTSMVALSEATHKVMLAEVERLHGLKRQGLLARLKKHPELLDGVAHHREVAETATALGLHVESVTLGLLRQAAALSASERLLTNDSLTLSVMRQLGVSIIVTNDDDFDRVPGIRIFKPMRA